MALQLTQQERDRLDSLLKGFEADPYVRSMAAYTQHGVVDTFTHCRNVAALSWFIAKRLNLKVDERVLVTGAMLHDFYLYDWHGAGWRHSYMHPEAARRTAVEHFHVDKATQDVIASHMWPINPLRIPSSTEAWIVTIADKLVSTHETLFQRKEAKPLCG